MLSLQTAVPPAVPPATASVTPAGAGQPAPAPLDVLDWGRTRYEAAWRAQDALVARRIAGEAPDTLVFTEHEPVYTIGLRSGAEQHLVWQEAALAAEGIEVVKTNRGGDITYHGPGQIVGYPIVSLAPRKDLHAWLRFLEEVLMNSVGALGLVASRREGKTGIWIGSRKIAAIGVAVKRWVAYHGFALNVNTRLQHFGGIVPCGISATDGTVTSLQAELGREHDMDEVKKLLAGEFAALWPRYLGGGGGGGGG
ncbi:MAG: lipoyl(octanoyl) transferase LipB [Opitutaceae bacterium]|jgi:lipoyl(octanoyl) transferase|nr:lipoyl(octanoyl) transferase LipB [Opitutaceae bacterium]